MLNQTEFDFIINIQYPKSCAVPSWLHENTFKWKFPCENAPLGRQNEFNFSLKCIYEPFHKCIKLKGYIQMLLVIISVFLKGESGLGRGGGEGLPLVAQTSLPLPANSQQQIHKKFKKRKTIANISSLCQKFCFSLRKNAMFTMATSIYAHSLQSTHARQW